MKTTQPEITITTTTPVHSRNGYWDYKMDIAIGGETYTLECWKLATFLECGAHQDIDGSGLQLWGDAQPGGWRCLDSDSQDRGNPTAKHSDCTGYLTVSTSNESIEIPVPDGEDAEEFLERMEEALEAAVAANDVSEPDDEEIYEELEACYNDVLLTRIGRPYGSRQIFIGWKSEDGAIEAQTMKSHDDIPAQVCNTTKNQLKAGIAALSERSF